MARRGGLGKGLDSLIPSVDLSVDTEDKSEETRKVKKATKEVVETVIEKIDSMVKISLVEPNKEQPRKSFDEDALNELAESIKIHGIIQPLVVVEKDKHFEIVTGERRWRAAKLAGLKEVPVIVKKLSDKEIMELSLIENIQRENLNPIEEAMAYKRLTKEFHMKQEEIASRVGKSRVAVANALRLLNLDDAVQTMLINKQITSGHARAILGLESHDEQYDLATRVIEEGLSVREVEDIVHEMNNSPAKDESAKNEPDKESEQIRIFYEKYESLLKSLMGTKVNIRKKKDDKGKIEIEYYSMEELERLLDLLQKLPKDFE